MVARRLETRLRGIRGEDRVFRTYEGRRLRDRSLVHDVPEGVLRRRLRLREIPFVVVFLRFLHLRVTQQGILPGRLLASKRTRGGGGLTAGSFPGEGKLGLRLRSFVVVSAEGRSPGRRRPGGSRPNAVQFG